MFRRGIAGSYGYLTVMREFLLFSLAGIFILAWPTFLGRPVVFNLGNPTRLREIETSLLKGAYKTTQNYCCLGETPEETGEVAGVT